jgi:hypothetical protein
VGVVTGPEWKTDALATRKVNKLKKTWQSNPQPKGEGTFLRHFTEPAAAADCAAVAFATLLALGLFSSASHTMSPSEMTLLQNEPNARAQMLHIDIDHPFRETTVTVICAFSEAFALRVRHATTGAVLVVAVPHGSMCVLGGWCVHGGAAATGYGTGPRVFGVARLRSQPWVRPGLFDPTP